MGRVRVWTDSRETRVERVVTCVDSRGFGPMTVLLEDHRKSWRVLVTLVMTSD